MKIKPNPYQPRKEFEPRALEDLADSIRQYGVLQPLVVTRKETLRPDNHGMDVHYELIAGERRLRASKIAGLAQVPVIIRKETDDKVKLELAIIENLQREDLNPIDRALAFEQLYKEFNLTHIEIGKRMGKSRVYVSNTLRLLSLPDEIKQGLMAGRITEGHTRPLLMLTDRAEEQMTLYKEIMVKKMSVRDAEKVARNIAQDKVRKKEFKIDPRIRDFEKKLSENLGTRVHIEPKENGGQITIDYFTINDLEEILGAMKKVEQDNNMMDRFLASQPQVDIPAVAAAANVDTDSLQQATGLKFNTNKVNQIPLNPETVVSKATISDPHGVVEYHDALPQYTKHQNTDIEPYHEEITAPKQEQVTDSIPARTEPEVTTTSFDASAGMLGKDNGLSAINTPVFKTEDSAMTYSEPATESLQQFTDDLLTVDTSNTSVDQKHVDVADIDIPSAQQNIETSFQNLTTAIPETPEFEIPMVTPQEAISTSNNVLTQLTQNYQQHQNADPYNETISSDDYLFETAVDIEQGMQVPPTSNMNIEYTQPPTSQTPNPFPEYVSRDEQGEYATHQASVQNQYQQAPEYQQSANQGYSGTAYYQQQQPVVQPKRKGFFGRIFGN